MTYCCCMWSELGVDKSNFDPDRDDYRPTSSNEILTRVDNINEIREYSDNTLDKDFILDPDVELERNFILNEICKKKRLNLRRDSILMKGLQKTYFGDGNLIKDKNAVKGQYLSVGVGECFALLGANGAGKTTTFKMCTGLEDPTSGTAFVNGYDIVRSRSRAQRSMGLCPQFDTLIERLSVAENILYFARMKGLKAEDAPRIMQVYMKALNIKKFEHMSVLQLSGGTRRKVSLIVALLGCPPAIFLDEPSTGLDPVASRLMWNLLTLVRDAKQTAMVLTTHNMLECESVCTRIGVMKNGELVCIGDSQHLRSRHGTGFLLNIRIEAEQYTEAVKSFVRTEFAESVVIDEYATHLHYEIKSDKKLSEMFRLFEENKDQLHVVEYVLSQSSLEQVFLKKIRSNEGDEIEEESIDDIMKKVPVKCRDYFYGYFMLAMTVIIPGAHHFWLKDWYMGFYYFFTLNLLYIGTILDFFRMTFLLKRSIMKHGHVKIGFCGCWFPNCRRCCSKCCAPFGWVDDAEVNDNNLGNDDIPRPSQQRFDIENPFIGSGQTITTTQDVVEQIDGEAASNVGEGVSAVAEFLDLFRV
jgi:ABC-type multidrug transport system ATPase subunit